MACVFWATLYMFHIVKRIRPCLVGGAVWKFCRLHDYVDWTEETNTARLTESEITLLIPPLRPRRFFRRDGPGGPGGPGGPSHAHNTTVLLATKKMLHWVVPFDHPLSLIVAPMYFGLVCTKANYNDKYIRRTVSLAKMSATTKLRLHRTHWNLTREQIPSSLCWNFGPQNGEFFSELWRRLVTAGQQTAGKFQTRSRVSTISTVDAATLRFAVYLTAVRRAQGGNSRIIDRARRCRSS